MTAEGIKSMAANAYHTTKDVSVKAIKWTGSNLNSIGGYVATRVATIGKLVLSILKAAKENIAEWGKIGFQYLKTSFYNTKEFLANHREGAIGATIGVTITAMLLMIIFGPNRAETPAS